jgi:methyl-accepting chemotaxis protein
MEKNAVLSPDDGESVRFAAQAEESATVLDRILPQLEERLNSANDAEAKQIFSEFVPAWQAYKVHQRDLLALARLNTNVKATAVLDAGFREQKQALDSLLQDTGAKNRKTRETERNPSQIRQLLELEVEINRAMWMSDRLLGLIHAHIAVTTEPKKLELDTEIAKALSAMESSLETLKALASEEDRILVSQALGHSSKLKTSLDQLREFSHINSNARSTELTLTRTVELGTACDDLLARLNGLMGVRVEAGRNDVHEAYLLGMAMIVGASFLGILGGIIMARRLVRTVTEGVEQGVAVAEALSRGDLTQRLNLVQEDEIGTLTRAIDHASENFAVIIADIAVLSEQIGRSAAELGSVSHQMLAQSEEMSTQSGFVSGSTDQLTININTMAAAAEQMSMNVASISSASEEISVNVGAVSTAAGLASGNVESVVRTIDQTTRSLEIVAQDAGEGAKMTAQASALAASATETMNSLDHSASEIGKITEMIKLIAMQTNMLALNAMIEATSAGEAGKGFAVVANEIKQLANQSGKAAEDIARMIEGIQGNTRSAVAVIDTVATTISEINASSERIYQAVESQTDTAVKSAEKLMGASQGVADIARSITEVAKGAIDMSRNASEAARAATDVSQNASGAAHGAQDIAVNIRGVSQATLQNTASAEQVNQTATHLSKIAGSLSSIIQRFHVEGAKQAA